MKTYKLLTLICSTLIIYANSCTQQQQVGNGLILTAAPGGIIYLDSTRTFHFTTTLYNPTKDTLTFETWDCSYELLFVTDSKKYKVQCRYDCYKNGPESM